MKRASIPACFVFHDKVERVNRDAVSAQAGARDKTA